MKKLSKLILVCFSIAFVFGCKQIVDVKTYYLNTYTVHFDANGGSGTMKSQTFSQNKEQQLSKNAFEAPDGSQFAGCGPQILMFFLMKLNTPTLNLSP